MQFHYLKVKGTYNTNVDDKYCSIDFVALGWGGGKRPPSENLEEP